MADVTPHNLVAERNLLGAMLNRAGAVDVAHRLITAGEFYDRGHQTTFATCVDLWLAGGAVDAVTVSEQTRHLDPSTARLTVGQLRELASSAPAVSDQAVARYAEIVVDHATLRNLQRIGQRIHDQARDLADPAELVEQAQQWIADAHTPTVDEPPGPDIDAFLAEKADTDWLVPDFLERTDRLVLTGAEGRGKSTVLRQAGVQMAAGIVPFTVGVPCEPVRVLLVDCENPRGKLQRQLHPLRRQAGAQLEPSRFVPIPVERGLDLSNRADRRWLENRVRANRPDVLITGPIYKLHSGDPNEERPAARLRDFFDDLRTRYGFALLLEAHQPYASGGNRRPLRPYGASLWSRWPDIGLCLLEGDNEWTFAEFRGLREDRPAWPVKVTRDPRQAWPWLAAAREF